MTNVTIPLGVTSIASYTFTDCTKLETVEIPASVTNICDRAFYGCKKLKNITVKTKKLDVKKVGKSAFKGINSKATIKVPKSKYKAYKILLKKKGVGKKVSL